MIELPENSTIRLDRSQAQDTLVLPRKGSRLGRWVLGLVMTGWLVGWAFGWVSAASQLITRSGGVPAKTWIFLSIWLTVWTIGGILVVWKLFGLIRPAVPEVLTFELDRIRYDSGVAPLAPRPQKGFGMISEKRKKLVFERQDIQTLSLRELESGNRLTMDLSGQRISIGRDIGEPDREWLFLYIRTRYRLKTDLDEKHRDI